MCGYLYGIPHRTFYNLKSILELYFREKHCFLTLMKKLKICNHLLYDSEVYLA